MSNKSASLNFRREVLLYLLQQGFLVTSARELRISERLSGINGGHIWGVDPWVITTHSRQELELSTDMTEVKNHAAMSNSQWYATIHKRKSHNVEDAYVTMPLAVFARILHRAIEQVPPPESAPAQAATETQEDQVQDDA